MGWLSLSHALAFALGVVVTFVILSTYFALKVRHAAHRRSHGNRGASGAVSGEDPDDEALFRCEYHQVNFHDEDDAREHAIEYHNAPRDGETWKATYGSDNE